MSETASTSLGREPDEMDVMQAALASEVLGRHVSAKEVSVLLKEHDLAVSPQGSFGGGGKAVQLARRAWAAEGAAVAQAAPTLGEA